MIVAECYREAALGQGFGFLLMPSIRTHYPDRSHALRGNAAPDALRPALTQSVNGCIPTQSVGTINGGRLNNPGAYETPNARRSR
jgi:hypothetical protein